MDWTLIFIYIQCHPTPHLFVDRIGDEVDSIEGGR